MVMGNPRSLHMLKHVLSPEEIEQHFGSADPKDVSREINRLGQRELQAKFRIVYGTQTFSNNNNWLRRKLIEAAGLQAPKAAGRGRPTSKSQSGRHSSGLQGPSSSGRMPDSPTMSRTSSMASQLSGALIQLGEVRRTKRRRKPRTFDDMMPAKRSMLPEKTIRLSGTPTMKHSSYCGMARQTSAEAMAPTTPAHINSLLAALGDPGMGLGLPSTTDLIWGHSPGQGFSHGHILVADTPPTPGTATPSALPEWLPRPPATSFSATMAAAKKLLSGTLTEPLPYSAWPPGFAATAVGGDDSSPHPADSDSSAATMHVKGSGLDAATQSFPDLPKPTGSLLPSAFDDIFDIPDIVAPPPPTPSKDAGRAGVAPNTPGIAHGARMPVSPAAISPRPGNHLSDTLGSLASLRAAGHLAEPEGFLPRMAAASRTAAGGSLDYLLEDAPQLPGFGEEPAMLDRLWDCPDLGAQPLLNCPF